MATSKRHSEFACSSWIATEATRVGADDAAYLVLVLGILVSLSRTHGWSSLTQTWNRHLLSDFTFLLSLGRKVWWRGEVKEEKAAGILEAETQPCGRIPTRSTFIPVICTTMSISIQSHDYLNKAILFAHSTIFTCIL